MFFIIYLPNSSTGSGKSNSEQVSPCESCKSCDGRKINSGQDPRLAKLLKICFKYVLFVAAAVETYISVDSDGVRYLYSGVGIRVVMCVS